MERVCRPDQRILVFSLARLILAQYAIFSKEFYPSYINLELSTSFFLHVNDCSPILNTYKNSHQMNGQNIYDNSTISKNITTRTSTTKPTYRYDDHPRSVIHGGVKEAQDAFATTPGDAGTELLWQTNKFNEFLICQKAHNLRKLFCTT